MSLKLFSLDVRIYSYFPRILLLVIPTLMLCQLGYICSYCNNIDVRDKKFTVKKENRKIGHLIYIYYIKILRLLQIVYTIVCTKFKYD